MNFGSFPFSTSECLFLLKTYENLYKQEMFNSTAHCHRLNKMKTKTTFTFRKGFCNCCKKQLALEEDIYRCSDCDFNLCEQCYEGDTDSKFHHHKLKPANTCVIYPHTNGDWRCDGCSRVFSPDRDKWTKHCEKCLIDLCVTCSETGWKHGLHPDHELFPVDARIEHRFSESWFCDNCGDRHSTNHDEPQKVFHCQTCQGDGTDLCCNCFNGLKYWQHHHNLTQVNKLAYKRWFTCSVCYSQVDSYDGVLVCVQADCGYSLCRGCSKKTPPNHPLHMHALHCSDSSQVYQEYGGMWQCDNCTEQDPLKRVQTRTSAEGMWHCNLCNYDLCNNCYRTFLPSHREYLDFGGSEPTLQSPKEQSLESYNSENSLIIGGSLLSQAMPYRQIPSHSYRPEDGYQMINQQPNSQMVIGFRSGPEPPRN